MKKNYLLIAFILIFMAMSFSAYAQNNSLKVSIVSGKVLLQKAGLTKWEPLKLNTQLKENDMLKFEANSYALFTTNDKRFVEYNKEGNIKVKTILENNKNNLSAAVKNVVQNIVNDVISTSNNVTVASLSERAITKEAVLYTEIPKNRCYLFDTLITFSWYSGCNTYNFSILDGQNKTVYSTSLKDTFITIDPSDEKIFLSYDTYYKWLVSCDELNKTSDTEYFLILSQKASQNIKDSINQIISQIGNPNELAFPNIVLASFYTRNFLFLEAEKAYKNALRISPNFEFKKLYANFLINIGNYTKAKELLGKN